MNYYQMIVATMSSCVLVLLRVAMGRYYGACEFTYAFVTYGFHVFDFVFMVELGVVDYLLCRKRGANMVLGVVQSTNQLLTCIALVFTGLGFWAGLQLAR